jgi:glycyl-tRNA synthetase beta chain
VPQLLVELFSEEIPARMQGGAARDFERMAKECLAAAELPYESLTTYAGPRRLTLVVEGLPAAQADRTEELKGPKVGAPPQALEGFLKKTGLTQDQLVEKDGVYFASLSRTGRPTPEIVAEMVDAIVRAFPWPKSMRWGSGSLRWVRPLKSIVALFGGKVVEFEIDGIGSGNTTWGHRFMGADHAPFAVSDFADYKEKLAAHYVVLDVEERKARILEGARKACEAEGLALVDDIGLLEEVAGLAEWPTPILGKMDPAFLDLPAEVIRTSMRTHQKYFAVADPRGTGLAARFVVVSNIEAADKGAVVAAGNAKVLSARLSDARFFWDEDRKTPLEQRLETLKGVTFHAKLGTMAERVDRIATLAAQLASPVGADVRLAEIAAKLAKADLATGMVGEFPELQGIMGGYYARLEPYAGRAAVTGEVEPDGTEDPLAGTEQLELAPVAGCTWPSGLSRQDVDAIADAVRDHYKPQGPGDSVPTAPVTVAVALADKLDTLTGFFAIDEKPTGSKDPYALRRAALGVIRLILETGSPFSLREALRYSGAILSERVAGADGYGAELLAFFADRLKVLLRDQGKRHDLVDAVFALGDDDLVRIVARVEALSGFLATDDGSNLLAGYKRAVNILRAEAKKNPAEEGDYRAPFNLTLASAPEETALAVATSTARPALDDALEREDFATAMTILAGLRGPVDGFLDKVLVNDDKAAVRMNRLRLLSQVRDLANRVADFSLISQ